jgi:hypothetical protein
LTPAEIGALLALLRGVEQMSTATMKEQGERQHIPSIRISPARE